MNFERRLYRYAAQAIAGVLIGVASTPPIVALLWLFGLLPA